MTEAQHFAVLRQLPASVDLAAAVIGEADPVVEILLTVERAVKGQYQRRRTVQLQLGQVDHRESACRGLRRRRISRLQRRLRAAQ